MRFSFIDAKKAEFPVTCLCEVLEVSQSGYFAWKSRPASERQRKDMLLLALSLISANKGVFGVNLGHLWGEIDRIRGWGEQLLDLWTQGAIKPKIARSFTFNEAADAHHFIQDRKNIGKVLLVP
jgi:NADPH:quinone reductase-like Zn-dependent oxidoreductase